MDIAKQKEQFNIAYICALAAQAGLNHSVRAVDDDSVDITFHGRMYLGKPVRNPQIEIQLKSTSKNLVSGEMIKFPLKKKNYDDLRGHDLVSPRYLAVLLIPESPDDWLRHEVDFMSLHNACYWTSIRNAPDSVNATSVTVDVPLNQRLTTKQLLQLVSLASDGVAL
jgi:hypothetical protein